MGLTSYSRFTHESGEQGIRGSEIEHQLSEFLRQKFLRNFFKANREVNRGLVTGQPFLHYSNQETPWEHQQLTWSRWLLPLLTPIALKFSVKQSAGASLLERETSTAILFAEEPKRAHLSKLKSRLTGPIFADVSHGVDVQKSCCLSNSQQRRLNLTLQFHTAVPSWLGNRNLKQIIITECWSSFFTIFGQIDL